MPTELEIEQETEDEIVSLLTKEPPKTKDRRSYEDYVNKPEPEHVEGDEGLEKVGFEVPDKFKGKSLADVIESYTQLESEYGRRNTEIGTLRSLADELLELKKQPEKKPERKKLEVDTLLDDPDTAINEAVDNNPRLKAIEDKLAREAIDEAKTKFEAKHPDWEETLRTSEFLEWVKESPVRKQMLLHADANSDYLVGTELFDNYALAKGNAIKEATQERDKNARQGAKKQVTESGGAGGDGKKTRKFKRSELIHMKLTDPLRYDAMRDEIMDAYSKGNVI